jgi:hypothetical protein
MVGLLLGLLLSVGGAGGAPSREDAGASAEELRRLERGFARVAAEVGPSVVATALAIVSMPAFKDRRASSVKTSCFAIG